VDVDLSPAIWHKSTFSNGSGGNCVETAKTPDGGRAVRHSKHPDEPSLVFTASEWEEFVQGVRNGEFD